MNEVLIQQFQKRLEKVSQFERDSLIERDKWGEITFEAATGDIDRIFQVVGYLTILPIEYLPEKVLNQADAALKEVIQIFTQIDAFSISAANAPQTRDQHVATIKQRADTLYERIAQWIPFLAYQKGDVTENIKKLTESVASADTIVTNAKNDIETKQGEIQEIITKAREASAAAGAAVFTKDFLNEAADLGSGAKGWLKATVALATLTFGLAIAAAFYRPTGLDSGQIAQLLVSKFALLGLLITSVLWCGRIYKAQMHQSTVNRHRALSIQTLQAFANAADDPQAKDAVLLEASRAVFSNVATGYIASKEGNQDTSVKIFDVAKSMVDRESS
jgi:hypothetical protein